MYEVERHRIVAAPPDKVKAALQDVEHLNRLLPQAEKVEVRGVTADRARVMLALRIGPMGLQRVDGEARFLPNGVRFVAVHPMQVDARWTVEPKGEGSEVTAYLRVQPGGLLQSFGRFLPRRPVENQIGQELDASLQALATIATE
jgi:carbon monoxide dehydrogenase subunit G